MQTIRGTALFLLSALTAWPSLDAAEPAASQKGFSELVDVDVVNVEVYVTAADGRPAAGLQRGDFTLLEDGKPMDLVNFAAVDRRAVPAAAEAAARASSQPAAADGEAEAAADPLHLVVYMDSTHLVPGHRTRVLRQLRGFLTQRLAPGDRVMLVTYDPGLHVRLPFTADRAAIGRALDALEKVVSDGGGDDRARGAALQQVIDVQERAAALNQKEAAREDRLGHRGSGDEESQPANPDSIQDTLCPPEIAEPVKSYADTARQEVLRSITGLTVLVNSLSGLPGRKALVHVSDGLSVTPGEELFQVLYEICGGGSASGARGVPTADAQLLGARVYKGSQAMLDAQAYSTAKQWTDLAAHASSQRVTFYTLQASGLEAGNGSAADLGPGERLLQLQSVTAIETANRRGSLSALASGTGGRAVFDANDLRPEIARLEDDLSHYYSLGYTPAHRGDGKEHRIEVKVKPRGLQVRHREVYRDKPLLERAADRTLSALFLGHGDNPLGVKLELGDIAPGQASGYVVPIRLLIPLANVGLSMRGDGYDGKLRILVATMSAGGGNSPVRQMEVPLRIPMRGSGAAMVQTYLYEIKLTLPPGEHRVAVGIRDDVTTLASFLAQDLHVGGGPAR